MDATLIRAFVSSIQNVFSTMLQLPVTVGEPYLKGPTGPETDISGIIGMSGDIVGSVVLSFPSSTAVAVVAIFAGAKYDVGSPDFADAVGELVNMVSGGAKGQFKNKKASISCPSVVIGGKHRIAGPSDVPCIVIPIKTDCGDLFIEVAIQERENSEGAAQASTRSAAN